jgi:hypothetical protein
MARPLYERVAARGFPVANFSGQSGEGALQDATAPPGKAGLPHEGWTDPNNDPASQPATVPPPEMYVLGGTMWGLPGAASPDNTPRTHAAPIADPTAPEAVYIAEATAAHAPMFTGVAERQHPGTLTRWRQGRQSGQGSSADTLQPLTGQIRAQGGLDAVQGYGGGGPGPGGVNEPQGPATDLAEWPGETYHNVFVSAAEVPLIVPSADQFIATAPELPPYMPTYDVPTASVKAQDVTATDIPAQGPPVGSGPVGMLPGVWGW